MGRKRGREDAEVVEITSVPHGSDVDRRRRQRRYIVVMTLCVASFLGAIVAAGVPWLALTLIGTALLLRVTAVILGNASTHSTAHGPEDPGLPTHPALGSGSGHPHR